MRRRGGGKPAARRGMVKRARQGQGLPSDDHSAVGGAWAVTSGGGVDGRR